MFCHRPVGDDVVAGGGCAMTRERPIIFSAPMVRAILAGTKTQTRRVVKKLRHHWTAEERDDGSLWPRYPDYVTGGECDGWVPCPFGAPGDRLWAREQWAVGHDYDSWSPRHIPELPVDRRHYAATEDRGGLMWRSPIHMPRWASRLTLEIASVCVQRLQDISEADARAEGVRPTAPLYGDCGGWAHEGHRDAYMALCESIHGPGSWDANPWVWALEFRRVES